MEGLMYEMRQTQESEETFEFGLSAHFLWLPIGVGRVLNV
jgi:hypothetical protein